MAYEEALLERMRKEFAGRKGISEKEMFGGVCFFVHGNMLCGVGGQSRYLFRVGKEQQAEALQRPGAEVMAFRGRPMGGMILVERAACEGKALNEWIALSMAFAGKLPPKSTKKNDARAAARQGARPRSKSSAARRPRGAAR